MPGMGDKPAGKMSERQMKDWEKMPEPAEGKEPANVVAQIWDDQKQILTRTVIQAPAAEIDVRYDALLANRRPLNDPESPSRGAWRMVLPPVDRRLFRDQFLHRHRPVGSRGAGSGWTRGPSDQGQLFPTWHSAANGPKTKHPKARRRFSDPCVG